MHILPGRPVGKPDQMSPIRAAVPLTGSASVRRGPSSLEPSEDEEHRGIGLRESGLRPGKWECAFRAIGLEANFLVRDEAGDEGRLDLAE